MWIIIFIDRWSIRLNLDIVLNRGNDWVKYKVYKV